MNCYNIAKQIYDVIIGICSNLNNKSDNILSDKKYVKFDEYILDSELESEKKVMKCLIECLSHKICIREDKKGSSKYLTLDAEYN